MPPEKQLELFNGLEWFDPAKLDSFTEEASEILRKNPLMDDPRRDAVLRGLERNIAMVSNHAKDIRQKRAAFMDSVNGFDYAPADILQ